MSEICGVRMTTAALFCDGPAGHTGAHFHRADLTPQTRVEQYETIISLLTALAEELRREKAAHETLAYNQVQLQRAVEALSHPPSKPNVGEATAASNQGVGLANIIGLIKSAIGDCVDEQPHIEIRMKLWDIVRTLYKFAAAPQCREATAQQVKHNAVVTKKRKHQR